jgi:hypothetical protein
MIDCIKLCAKSELLLHGDDKTLHLENPAIFQGLLEFAGKLDKSFKTLRDVPRGNMCRN